MNENPPVAPSHWRVDRTVGLARGLVFAWTSGAAQIGAKGAHAQDLVSGSVGSTGTTAADASFGRHYYLSGPLTAYRGINFGILRRLQLVSGFTLMALAKVLTNSDYGALISTRSGNDGWELMHNSGQFHLRLGDGAALNVVTDSVDYSGSWHTVVGTHEASVASKLYVDGVQAASGSVGNVIYGGTHNVCVGNNGVLNESGHAYIACAYMWSRVLSESEIRAMHHDPYRALGPSKVLGAALHHASFPIDPYGCAELTRPSDTCTITASNC